MQGCTAYCENRDYNSCPSNPWNYSKLTWISSKCRTLCATIYEHVPRLGMLGVSVFEVTSKTQRGRLRVTINLSANKRLRMRRTHMNYQTQRCKHFPKVILSVRLAVKGNMCLNRTELARHSTEQLESYRRSELDSETPAQTEGEGNTKCRKRSKRGKS